MSGFAIPAPKQALIALLCVSSILALTACGGSSKSTVIGEGSDRFPSETYTDWVSYGDQLSIVSVLSEEELAARREDLERGEGYIGRAVTLRIEQTLWQRTGAPSADGTIRVITWGWVLEEGRHRLITGWGGPRLEAGGRYLAPLVRAPRDGVEWTVLSDSATLPLEGDLITVAGVVGNPSPIAEAMRGKSPAALAAILALTSPDPIAKSYWDRPPDERFYAVSREREERN